MSQRQFINLYLPEFRKREEWLDAARAVQLCGLVIGVLALLGGYQYWRSSSANAALADIEQQRQQAVLATQQLSEAAGALVQDQNLMRRIETLEESLESKQALLQFMNGRQHDNVDGFSEYLADLARYHTSGLGLKTVRITEGGNAVQLEGEVLRAELVPLYLQNLSQGASYKGKDFRAFEIAETTPSLLGRLSDLVGSTTATPSVWRFSVSTDGSRKP
ncbi:MAG TPA: hypothetical protein VNR18_03050 [Hyphomicrobiales bacterium]|nr:hypothetical protein [Hyphomicrobiales bacterium]